MELSLGGAPLQDDDSSEWVFYVAEVRDPDTQEMIGLKGIEARRVGNRVIFRDAEKIPDQE